MSSLRRARGYAPLQWSAHDAAIVDQMYRLARERGPGHVAVFDLDGCLFDTRQRQVHILWELAHHESWWPLFRVSEEHFVDWSLDHTLRNAGVDERWIEAHISRIRDWWGERFFHSDYMVHDLAMPGAVRLVREVHEAGLHVVYLTGRDERMRPGTEASLRRAGFPMADRSTLIVKPEFHMDDTAFKEGALEGIAAFGRIVLYLDNEPANVNMYRLRHPEAMVVFVETDHSPRPIEPDPAIPWIRSFLPVRA